MEAEASILIQLPGAQVERDAAGAAAIGILASTWADAPPAGGGHSSPLGPDPKRLVLVVCKPRERQTIISRDSRFCKYRENWFFSRDVTVNPCEQMGLVEEHVAEWRMIINSLKNACFNGLHYCIRLSKMLSEAI